jgi:hypothetical protein
MKWPRSVKENWVRGAVLEQSPNLLVVESVEPLSLLLSAERNMERNGSRQWPQPESDGKSGEGKSVGNA